VIQPQAVKSQIVTPSPPPTVTTSSLRSAARPNMTAKQPLISSTTPAKVAQPVGPGSVEGPVGREVIGVGAVLMMRAPSSCAGWTRLTHRG
jgi:hypothetical protein